MATQRQRDSNAGRLHENVHEWFRLFVKHLELHLVDTGSKLPGEAESEDCSFAAMQAVKRTLRDAGLDDDQIVNLFARVAFENRPSAEQREWNADLNTRRFQLIDGDIQGTLTAAEQLELATLTELMRQHVDSEPNLPLKGPESCTAVWLAWSRNRRTRSSDLRLPRAAIRTSAWASRLRRV